MNNKKSNSRARMSKKRREAVKRSRRMFSTVSLLISVIAMVECIILLSFTTFSWIESSSSLIISSGDRGNDPIDVADNINYKIIVSSAAEGKANLSGFFRRVDNFRFAKVSSPDGVEMYFPKKNNLNTSATGYRKGDTTDYNISYTYFDFKVENSSGIEKLFYFKDGSNTNLFTIKKTSGDPDIDAAILNAMRISFTAENSTDTLKKVYSLTSDSTGTVKNTSGGLTTDNSGTALTTTAVNDSVYDPDDYMGSKRIFKVAEDEEVSVSVRIWLEEKKLPAPSTASELTAEELAATGMTADEYNAYQITELSKKLAEAQVGVDLELVADNFVYDKLYFYDYGYSTENGYVGNHATMTGKTMYFYAWNSQRAAQKYIAYPMTLLSTSPVPCWVASCPVEYVYGNLSSADPEHPAFFGYGELPENSKLSTPSIAPYYRWDLPGALNVDTVGSGDDIEYKSLNYSTKYVYGFGATRSKATYSTIESIEGYAMFKDASSYTPELVNFADRATAFTGAGYNADDTSVDPVVKNYRFITESKNSTTSTTVDYSNIYYADIPSGTHQILFTNGSSDTGANQTSNYIIGSDDDGTCYIRDGSNQCEKYTSAPPLPTSDQLGLTGTRRIYFYNNVGWSSVRIFAMDSSTNGISGFNEQFSDRVEMSIYSRSQYSEITNYNYNIYFAGASSSASTAAITPYYDEYNEVFTAYVPSTWLTGGMYVRYNPDGYYSTSSKIVWNTPTLSASDAGSSPTYTAIGYTGTTYLNDVYTVENDTVADLDNKVGMGTWESVRAISFSTEIIDSTISSTNSYTISIDGGSSYYAMAPDAIGLKFSAYVPSSATSVKFLRYVPGETPVYTVWNPTNITSVDKTYYAVSDTAGYFHLAVLVDGSYENLISSIKADNDVDTTDTLSSTLTARIDGAGEPIDLFTSPYQLSDGTRWIVPYDNGAEYITYVWKPYDHDGDNNDTVFTYTQYLNEGMYYIITE